MNKTNNNKLIFGGALGGLFLVIARACAETNAAPMLAIGAAEDPNIVSAAYHQILNNPASLTVIAFLCVVAWLCDDLPFVNSRYVPHLTVTIGGAIYWLFAGPSSVPRNFPYPAAVLVANGVMCGFVAFIIHRQAVARVIQFVRSKSGDTTFLQKQNQNPSQNP